MSKPTDSQPSHGIEGGGAETHISRRKMISAVGLTALAATGAFAQTLRAVPSEAGRANPNGRFKGKVVLITGATSGIGEGTAHAFAHEGARVFFCGRRENLGRQVESSIKGLGGEVHICAPMCGVKRMSGSSLTRV